MLERPPVATEDEQLEAFQNAFTPQIEQLNAKYPYWDKVKYANTYNSLTAKQQWFALKLLRQFNRTMLNFGSYKFSFRVTDEILQLLHYFDMNVGGNLTGEHIIPSDKKEVYLISSIMEEAIASSQMEGAATTRKVAKDMLRKNNKPQEKGQQMIVNNYNTINLIKENSKKEFSIATLKELHFSMTENTLDDPQDAGQFRENNDIMVVNGITGSVAHIPPSYEELDQLLLALENFFNKEQEQFVHPIIKAIVVHFMLSYIHPFVDGNGRTARSLFYWYMMKNGYWLIEYISISRIIAKKKVAYEKAFLYTEYDDNDLTYFILYNLRVMKEAFEELKLYLQRKTEESKSITTLVAIEGINQRQAQIIQIIQDKPDVAFTVKEIENRFSISNYTARTDLDGLVNLGYLIIIQINKVKKAYAKSSNFDNLLNT